MTCNQCLHRELCNVHGYIDADECACFKDKSRYIYLPCVKGDVLQYDGTDYTIDHWNIIATAFSKENKLHLFGLEEAESALKEESEKGSDRDV